MISGSITLLAVADAEFTRIRLSSDTIAVDPYNVQSEPLVVTVERVSGDRVSSASAYVSVQALSIGKPVSGASRDFGLCTRAEFTIPARDRLYATATAVRVDAYSDAAKKSLIESRTVNVVCSQIPEPLYRGEAWTSGMTFRNGDFLERKANGSTSIYQWSSRVEGNTSKAPWNITSTADPEYGYWEHVTEKTLFAARVLLVRSALVGSAVFNGDYTISQHGTAHKSGATYQDFDGTTDKFEPNIIINWLTGTMRALELYISGNSRFSGVLDGVIGSFRSLRCASRQNGSDGQPVEIEGGSIDFFPVGDRGAIGFTGDIYHESGLLGVYSKFHADSMLCKGVFSARMRTTMMVTGDRATVYKDGVYSQGYEILLTRQTLNNSEVYYTLPCYHAQMPIAETPIDTIVFCVPAGADYNYELDMFDTQRVLVVNTHQNTARIVIYTLGGRKTLLESGEVRELVKMRTLTKPGQASQVGNGLYAGPFHLNEWL